MITRTPLLTPEWKPLDYHAEQSRLWRSRARWKIVAAGRGSGKTEIARRYLVRWLPITKAWSDPTYLYCLPTFAQAKRVAWQRLKALVPKRWLADSPNETDLTIRTIYGSSLVVVGMDKPQRIEGNQYDGVIVDEASDQRPKMFDLTLRPALTHRNGFGWRIGVPKRAGIGASEFKEEFQKGLKLEAGRESYTWPSEDILSEEEIRNARDSMDEKDFNEQFRASWESLAGLVFYAFSDIQNLSNELYYSPNLPLLIGSDFNVDPMAWVVCQAQGPHLHVFDEFFIRNTNTQEALDRLYAKYGDHKAGIIFFGDASGRARKTSASMSDYLQIRSDTRFINARVMYPQSNPARADRFASCNAMFCNANKLRRCYVHPRCKNLIKDLTHRSYKAGESEPDDSGDVGHISDALGYLIHYLYPFTLNLSEKTPEVAAF